MSPRALIVTDRARAAPARDLELCVVTACHDLLCALPVRWVERLLLPQEVATVVTAAPKPWSLLLVGERQLAAWNLGTLLGLAPLTAAWVLLRVPHRGGELSIALNTGAFATDGLRGRATAAPLGLWLDPARLFTDEELAAAALEAGGSD